MDGPVRMGPYELVGSLGAGGMGVVHEARDTRLGRTVALKVLPPQAVEDPDARARFLREARLAAALNHPNIVTVYDADVAHTAEGDRLYIAMERVTGRTLDDCLREKVPGVEQVLDWAVQIAEALAHAHAANIVHRDLKPSNVMLLPDDRVKVLDFGLAKHVASLDTRPEAPTATIDDATMAGTVVGTAAYMSPEQAEGHHADARSDLFSFGTLLYEALTGERPFRGDSTASLFGALLRDTPPAPSTRRAEVGADLDRIVEKALQKKPEDRYQHADEMLVDLRAARRTLVGSGTHATSAPSASPAPRPRWWVWAATAGVVVALLAAAWGWVRLSEPPAQVMRFISPLPDGYGFDKAGGFGSSIALSPDGSLMVLAAYSREKKTSVLLRQRIGEFSASPIENTDGARAPFISYDGRWVGFVDGADVNRVSLTGPTVRESTEALDWGREHLLSVDIAFFGGDFDRNGDTIVIGECSRGLREWSLSRQEKERISDIAPDALGVLQHQFPQVLPDGEHLLLTAWRGTDSELHVRNRRTGEERLLVEHATYGRFAASGHIVYAWEGNLYAVPFDPDGLEVTGTPVKVVEGVLTEQWRGAAHFTISENGTLAYLPGGFYRNTLGLALVGRDGEVERTESRAGVGVAFSPDGSEIVAGQDFGALQQLWIYERARRLWRLLAGPPEGELLGAYWPVWTPDGRSVWYLSGSSIGRANLAHVAADGSEPPVYLQEGATWQQPQSWTPDGRILVYSQGSGPASSYDIWTLDVATGTRAPLVDTSAGELHPALSPDGRWLAYATNASGAFRVVVRPFDGSGPVVVASGDHHAEPVWSSDGRTIYFRTADGRRILAASFEPGPPPKIGNPSVAFEGEFSGAVAFGRSWALSPDGQTAAVWLRPEPLVGGDQYVVILNWLDELRRLVPTG